MKKNKIALQLYSVRDEMQTDFYGTLKAIKKLGYSGVEFAGLFDNNPNDVKIYCEEIGLVLLSAHVPLIELMENTDEVITSYKELGVKYIVIPYLTPEYRPGTAGFQTVINMAKTIGAKLADAGMVLQYHNHDFEFEKLNGEYALDILYKEVGPELLQTQIDTCWVNVAGENPAQYLLKYMGRTPTIHLKDFSGAKSENMYALIGIDENEAKESKGTFEFRPLGKGRQNFASIVEAGDKCGAEWYIVEQDSPSMGYTSLECAQISVNYLLDNIAK